MSRLAADVSLDQIEDWFKIGKTVRIDTVPRSKLGGRNLDPTTGKAAIYQEKPFVPPYKRHARVNNPNQSAYAAYYKQADDEEAMRSAHSQVPHHLVGGPYAASIGESSHGNMESLETDSVVTAISGVTLPEGQTEAEVKEVYKRINLQHNYNTNLAITPYKEEIMETIESNQVTIIQGETGSGKTTQVPQYILDHYARQDRYCNIVVTQPRIIAAMSISRRVCHERGWQEGDICGYQVGMDKMTSPDTRILYCTTGVLKRILVGQKNMTQFTHVILDEVHERDRESDFCLLVVRKLLRTNSRDVKVILMSATLDTTEFADYFGVPVRGILEPAPVYSVEGRSYTVSEFYVEDLHKLGSIPHLDEDSPGISVEACQLAASLIQQFDKLEAHHGVGKDGLSKKRGSVLVFLPGLGEIQDLDEKLSAIKDKYKLYILPLHSSITGQEQVRVFEKPALNMRKVILSTNIAESSITVPDIKYVIDFCLTKNLVSDPETNYCSLQPQWASRANCEQRKGRAGRVANGRVYRMITRTFWNNHIVAFGIPEMQRCPLETLVLDSKSLDMGEPKAILGLALSPPNLDDIERTILLLKEVGALASLHTGEVNRHDGDLTFLGKVLAALPVDIRFGKLMVLGHVFGMLLETVIIAAAVSSKTFHARPYRTSLAAYNHKFSWSQDSFSDCIASLNAFKLWKQKVINGFFQAAPRAEETWCKEYFIQCRRIREADRLVDELSKRLAFFNIRVPHNAFNKEFTGDDELLLKLVMAGAFYPNYFSRSTVDEELVNRQLCGKNPQTTVVVRGLPANQGTLYRRNLEQLFTPCDHRNKPNVSVEETRAYIEFQRDPTDRNTSRVLHAVYLAIKMRQLRLPLEIQLLDSETVRKKMDELSLQNDLRSSSGKRLRTNRMEATGDESGEGPRQVQVELPPAVQSVIQIYVTEVKECGHFWGHYADKDTWNKMSCLQQGLNIMSGRNLKAMPPGQIRVGALCVAAYEDQTRDFYRARIIELLGARKVKVFYLDYGNDGIVPTIDLRQLEPEHLILPFQAMEFDLCGIRPSSVKCPNLKWTVEATEKFEAMVLEKADLFAKVFSKVHGVLRVDLYEKLPNNKEIHINNRLIQMAFADAAEESFESKQNHAEQEELRLFRRSSSSSGKKKEESGTNQAHVLGSQTDWMQVSLSDAINEADADMAVAVGARKRGGKITLHGPTSPCEMSFSSLTSVGRLREARIDRESVNSIVLTDTPQNQKMCMMVAAHVGLNPSGTVMQARDTTLLPEVDGLAAVVPMVFSPIMELRTDRQRKRFTGVLCGLGWDPYTGGPALPDHDMEITFDTEFTEQDITEINMVRMAINMVIGSEAAVSDWGPGLYRLQEKATNRLLGLARKRRPSLEPTPFNPPYRWNMVKPEEVLPPQIESHGSVLYNYHSLVALRTDEDEEPEETREMLLEKERLYKKEMTEHVSWLRKKANRSKASEEIICRLCDEKVPNPWYLMLHLTTRLHRQREASLI